MRVNLQRYASPEDARQAALDALDAAASGLIDRKVNAFVDREKLEDARAALAKPAGTALAVDHPWIAAEADARGIALRAAALLIGAAYQADKTRAVRIERQRIEYKEKLRAAATLKDIAQLRHAALAKIAGAA